MTRHHMKRSIIRQAATIKKLREELRIERGMNRVLCQMEYAPKQKRSHLVSLKKYAAKKGMTA